MELLSRTLKKTAVSALAACFMFACAACGLEQQELIKNPENGPAAGNPEGAYAVPDEAGLEDVSNPDSIVGDGTPESCTGDAFIAAVEQGVVQHLRQQRIAAAQRCVQIAAHGGFNSGADR